MTYIYIFEHETPHTSKYEPTHAERHLAKIGRLIILRAAGHPMVVEELRFGDKRVGMWVKIPDNIPQVVW